MKHVNICTKCEREFECTKENQGTSKKGKLISATHEIKLGHSRYKCEFCKHWDYYKGGKYVPFTIKELLTEIDCLQNAKNWKHIIGDVDHPIGFIKTCKDCGEPTGVVSYGDVGLYSKNHNVECECQRVNRERRWYEKDEDKHKHKKGEKCKFYDDLPVKKFREEDDEFQKCDDIVKLIFKHCPPRNDGILEFDKMTHMFGQLHAKCNTPDSMLHVHRAFQLYCAKHGLITK